MFYCSNLLLPVTSAHENSLCVTGLCLVEYLSICDAVDDGLQRFMRVTLDDPLHPADSGSNGLVHAHVQIVVVLLCSKVLKDRHRKVALLQ